MEILWKIIKGIGIFFGIIVAALVALAIIGSMYEHGSNGNKSENKDESYMEIINSHYDRCLTQIDESADELQGWYLGAKSGTLTAAEELTSLRSMWEKLWSSEEEYAVYALGVITKNTYTEEACKNKTQLCVNETVKYILADEQELYDELEQYAVAEGNNNEAISAFEHFKSEYDVNGEVSMEITNQIVSLIGSEIGAYILTELGIQAGVLATGAVAAPYTLGISVVAGIAVDGIISFFRNPEEKIKQKIDAQIDATAYQNRERFRKEMVKFLDQRRHLWIKAASSNRK